MKKIIGRLLIASPFIAVILLPLYTECSWFAIGLTMVIVGGVFGILALGFYLLEG